MTMRRHSYPYDYDLKSRFPQRRSAFGWEGGGLEIAEDGAEHNRRYYVIFDEGTMADFLDPTDPTDAEVLSQLITVLEFDSEAERNAYVQETRAEHARMQAAHTTHRSQYE
ncbi:MAG: hypothetical protein ABI068_03210 [Ktedonobacterales bacterium]